MSNIPITDQWRLTDVDKQSQNYGYEFLFDFTKFHSSEIKFITKQYVWGCYSTGSRVLGGLIESVRQLRIFDGFCLQFHISSMNTLTNNEIDNYCTFLRTYHSPYTKKPMAYSYQGGCLSTLKSLIGWCHVFMPEAVPPMQIFVGNEFRRSGHQAEIRFIPDDILVLVNTAINQERNPYLKYGLIILQGTGMRLGDLLLLTTDCIGEHPISGVTISWFDHKNRKFRSNLPIPPVCQNAIQSLISLTSEIRHEAEEKDVNYLFIYKPKLGRNKTPVVPVSRQVFTKWCHRFSEEHDIRDSGGTIFPITTHMFRRTLATNMLSKGANIKVIQEVLGHSSPAIAKKYYADIKDTEHIQMFEQIGVLGSLDQINKHHIGDDAERLWFAQHCHEKARLSDGYCTLPIQDGKPCGRFLSQNKCYLCSRYITTLDYLETHRRHLADLEDMVRNNIYGVHFASHITPTILVLKEIIFRLEQLQHEN